MSLLRKFNLVKFLKERQLWRPLVGRKVICKLSLNILRCYMFPFLNMCDFFVVTVTRTGDAVTVTTSAGEAGVVIADILANNGVIHLIDAVV